VLAGLSTVCGFALIWQIWWLVIASFVTLIGSAIVHTFNQDRDFHIPVDEIERVEAQRTQLLAQGA
jgi:cytochrome o ubiquinol oxidase subunit 1